MNTRYIPNIPEDWLREHRIQKALALIPQEKPKSLYKRDKEVFLWILFSSGAAVLNLIGLYGNLRKGNVSGGGLSFITVLVMVCICYIAWKERIK